MGLKNKLTKNYKWLFNIGCSFMRIDEVKIALYYFEQVQKVNQKYVNAYINSAYLYMKVGMYTEAKKQLDIAITHEPYSHKAKISLGNYYLEIGQCEKAVKLFAKLNDKTAKRNAEFAKLYISEVICHCQQFAQSITSDE